MEEEKANGHTPLKVYFTLPALELARIEGDFLVITPSSNDWNDFGNRILATIRVRFARGQIDFTTEALVGFLDPASSGSFGTKPLRDLLASQPVAVAEEVPLRFFTMLPSMELYREIVGALGVAEARLALLSAHDVVAAQEFEKSTPWLADAEKSSVFSMSFLRTSERYYAYKNAGSILHGLQFEELGKLSQSLRVKFALEGRDDPYDLTFEFDHASELPKRIAVVIGKNGVGKSQTLSHVAEAAVRGNSSDLPETSTMLTDGEGNRPLISRLLAFAPTNEAESVFPTPLRKRSPIWYRRFSMNRSRRAKNGEYVSDLILQVARSSNAIRDRSRWEIFCEALQALTSPETLRLPTMEGRYTSLLELKQANEQSVLERYASLDLKREPLRSMGEASYPLSSGEISFVKFAAQLCLHIENGSLILLDEPETHLHPNFISRFVLLLDTVLEQTGSSAIIATHSAYFVREVFKDQVMVLRLEDGEPVVDRPFMQTFGADVGAISYFVFGEDEPSRLATRMEERLVAKYRTWERLSEALDQEVSLEFLNDLRRRIETPR